MEGWEIFLIILGSIIYFVMGIFLSPLIMKRLNMPLSVNVILFFFFPPLWLCLLFVSLYIEKPKEAKTVKDVIPGKKYEIAYKKEKKSKKKK